MRSCVPVRRKSKYKIVKLPDRRAFAVIDREESHIITVAKTYDRAARHIIASTGRWPRCDHDWKPCKKVWNIGWEDSFKCEVCGAYKKNRRFLPRSMKKITGTHSRSQVIPATKI